MHLQSAYSTFLWLGEESVGSKLKSRNDFLVGRDLLFRLIFLLPICALPFTTEDWRIKRHH